MVTGVSSFSCFWLFLNDSLALKIISCSCSIAPFRFINSFLWVYIHWSNEIFQFYQVGVSFYPQASLQCFRMKNYRNIFLVPGGTFIVANNWSSLFSVVCSGTSRVLYRVNVLFLNVIYMLIFLALLIKYLHIWSSKKYLSLFY